MLEDIARDIETRQSPKQQSEKSKGLGGEQHADTESAASTHGTLREDSGFSLSQLIAEFRALRATVLRLWLPQLTEISEATSTDMLRFNEAIDQALAESALNFSHRSARTRDTFLGILGHDLRGPLATMTLAGDLLTSSGIDPERLAGIGPRVKSSAAMMTAMVHDLLEYARAQLGSGMPIARQQANMKDICEAALGDARAVHPDCPFELVTDGDLSGSFDRVRLQQVLTNLLNNAAQYRGKEHPVTIYPQGEPDAITVKVKNRGPVIPSESLQAIFNPLVQLVVEDKRDGRPATSLGLGLFIAREITMAHGGSINAESDEDTGTVFTIRIPRVPAEQKRELRK
jgi:signal transduction histidine kinase